MEENEVKKEEPVSFGDILKTKTAGKKPPAYAWQDLALRIQKELRIPPFKRSSIFKACRDYPRSVIERCLADTKELCKSGEQWRYFFKTLATSHQTENTESLHDQPQKEIHKTKDEVQDQRH
ncbi:MAG: hypothetical protein NTY12_03155 [Candidatus Falkowbacteria bacterium]|nr:hypothetical protein [Candidatus Falkowbacteria bacterium]